MRLLRHFFSTESLPYITIASLFGIVYLCAISFTYMEGDSASSVAFHALGRNALLQPFYSPYHGMMDLFLGFLPASEVIVRYAAISSSALAAIAVVMLTARLIRDWLPDVEARHLALVFSFVLLCSPEIFFLGMIYTPSLVAMSFVLAAHLLARFAYAQSVSPNPNGKYFVPIFVLSAALFGIGVSCRWDIGIYILFVCADIALQSENRGNLKRTLGFVFVWAVLAFTSSVLAVIVSGSGLNEIYWAVALAKREIANAESWHAAIGSYQTLATPAFAVFFIIGAVFLLGTRKKLAILSLAGILIVSPYIYSREPKMLLPAFPAMWLVVAAGINFVWFSGLRRDYLVPARVIAVILLITPWLLGIQISSAETSWGPGFEITQIAPQASHTSIPDRFSGALAADRSVSVAAWGISLDGGFAIPTPEGPRPLGGYGFVLLGGEWRLFAAERETERRTAIEHAMAARMNIFQDDGNSILVAMLAEMGFLTNDPKEDYGQNGISERNFTDGQGRFVTLQALKMRRSLSEPDLLSELLKLNPTGKVILYSGYSSTFRKLSDAYPRAMHILSPFSAVIDLEGLHDTARTLDHRQSN